MLDDGSQYLLHMFALLRYRYAIQAVRPTRHWWQGPRGLAWFQVLMVWSLVKPSACAEPLSRIGDYLRAARGPGLLLQIKKRTAFSHEISPTRGPPDPLFHRRSGLHSPVEHACSVVAHKTDVHTAGVQVDATVKWVLLGVEAHEVSFLFSRWLFSQGQHTTGVC